VHAIKFLKKTRSTYILHKFQTLAKLWQNNLMIFFTMKLIIILIFPEKIIQLFMSELT